jgi:hypothetical protein
MFSTLFRCAAERAAFRRATRRKDEGCVATAYPITAACLPHSIIWLALLVLHVFVGSLGVTCSSG